MIGGARFRVRMGRRPCGLGVHLGMGRDRGIDRIAVSSLDVALAARCSSFAMHVRTSKPRGSTTKKFQTKSKSETNPSKRQSQLRCGWFFLGLPLILPPASCAFPLRFTPALGMLRGFEHTRQTEIKARDASPNEAAPAWWMDMQTSKAVAQRRAPRTHN